MIEAGDNGLVGLLMQGYETFLFLAEELVEIFAINKILTFVYRSFYIESGLIAGFLLFFLRFLGRFGELGSLIVWILMESGRFRSQCWEILLKLSRNWDLARICWLLIGFLGKILRLAVSVKSFLGIGIKGTSTNFRFLIRLCENLGLLVELVNRCQ